MPVDNIYALTIGLKYAILIKNRARQSIVDPAPSQPEDAMKLTPLALALVLVTPVASVVSAQDLAKAAMPSPILFDTFAACLTEVAKVLPAKEAGKICLEVRKLEADRAKEAAKAAAKAAKNAAVAANQCLAGWLSRPSSCDGYLYGGYYIGSRGVTVGNRYAPPRPGPRQNIGYRLPNGQAVKK